MQCSHTPHTHTSLGLSIYAIAKIGGCKCHLRLTAPSPLQIVCRVGSNGAPPALTKNFVGDSPQVSYNTPSASFPGYYMSATTCDITLTVTDMNGGTDTNTTNLVIPAYPAPVPAANGPYNPTAVSGGAPLSSTGSAVPNGPGNYTWTVVCPASNTSKTYQGQSPNVTYNYAGADFGMFLTNTTCSANLTVTDANGIPTTTTSAINFPGVPAPTAQANGPYSPTALSGSLLLSSTGSQVPLGPGNYSWTVVCPPGGATNTKTFQGQTYAVTYNSIGSDFGPFTTATTCSITLSITDSAGRVATDVAPFNSPAVPPPVANAHGPYSPAGTQTSFALNSTGSSSALGPLASLDWAVSESIGMLDLPSVNWRFGSTLSLFSSMHQDHCPGQPLTSSLRLFTL